MFSVFATVGCYLLLLLLYGDFPWSALRLSDLGKVDLFKALLLLMLLKHASAKPGSIHPLAIYLKSIPK